MAHMPTPTIHGIHSLRIAPIMTNKIEETGRLYDAGGLIFDKDGEHFKIDLYAKEGLQAIMEQACREFLEKSKKENQYERCERDKF